MPQIIKKTPQPTAGCTVQLVDLRKPPGSIVDLTWQYDGSPPPTVPAKAARQVRAGNPSPAVRTVSKQSVGDQTTKLPGEGSGQFIRRLLAGGQYTHQQIVELVHQNWEGRKTTVADVRWNQSQMGLRNQSTTVRRLAPPFPSSHLMKSPQVVVNTRPGRIVVTGFTRKQAFPGLREVNQKIDVPAAVVAELIRQGVDVDWSVDDSIAGRPDFSAAFVCVAGCMSLHGCKYAAQALMTLKRALDLGVPTVVFYDDWKIGQTHDHLTSLHRYVNASSKKRFTNYGRLTEARYDEIKSDLIEVARLLTAGSLPDSWSVLIPKYSGWGNASVVPLQGRRLLSVDPTPAVIDLSFKSTVEPDREWLLAAIGDHSSWVDKSVRPSWPVKYAGYKKLGEYLPSERDVLEETARHWGVLCPPYPQSGSGWFRSRYVYSALAGRVLLAGEADQAVLGEPYGLTTASVENRSDVGLRLLAKRQREWLLDGGRVSTELSQFQDEVSKIKSALTGEV